jgi:ubiquinone/menaquinone biosynthesis C-methylase UbiE
MNLSDIERLYFLWERIYPYLAAQVASVLPERWERVLEVGPFAGGIAFELAMGRRSSPVVIADGRIEVLDYLAGEAVKRKLLNPIRWVQADLSGLPFQDGVFDGVIFRGAFFLLKGSILREIDRVLRPGGCGFIGGGFGAPTPQKLIDEISQESRTLNMRLGKKWISRSDLEQTLKQVSLEGRAEIVEQGGLWLCLHR